MPLGSLTVLLTLEQGPFSFFIRLQTNMGSWEIAPWLLLSRVSAQAGAPFESLRPPSRYIPKTIFLIPDWEPVHSSLAWWGPQALSVVEISVAAWWDDRILMTGRTLVARWKSACLMNLGDIYPVYCYLNGDAPCEGGAFPYPRPPSLLLSDLYDA